MYPVGTGRLGNVVTTSMQRRASTLIRRWPDGLCPLGRDLNGGSRSAFLNCGAESIVRNFGFSHNITAYSIETGNKTSHVICEQWRPWQIYILLGIWSAPYPFKDCAIAKTALGLWCLLMPEDVFFTWRESNEPRNKKKGCLGVNSNSNDADQPANIVWSVICYASLCSTVRNDSK